MENKSRIQWNIRLEQEKFLLDDWIRVTGVFTSDKEPVQKTVHSMIYSLEHKEYPKAIIPRIVSIKPASKEESAVYELKITDDFPPGKYRLKVGLELEPGTMDFKELDFQISGTRLPLDFQIEISSQAGKKTKVFAVTEKEAVVAVSSQAPGITVSGFCKPPKGESIPLKFEKMKASILLSGEGTYELKIKGEAPGYKSLTRKDTFGVIKTGPKFNDFDVLKA